MEMSLKNSNATNKNYSHGFSRYNDNKDIDNKISYYGNAKNLEEINKISETNLK